MKNFFSLLLTALCILNCQSVNQQSSYQKDSNLPKRVEIAVLLPLSGNQDPSQAFKESKLNELINLGLRDGSARNINVTSYDIANQQNIDSVMKKVIATKPNIILGPILSQDTSQVAMAAKQSGAIVISLSNNPAIADSDVYIFGHGPLQQTKRLIKYLADSSVNDVILLLPNTRESDNLANVVTDILVHNKITLAKTEKYLITPESIDEAAKSVSELIDSLNENPENVSKPAIYVSDDPENLVLIFKTLAKYDLDKKAIICGENKIDINDKDSIDITFTGSLNVLNSKLTKDLLHNKFGSDYLSFWDKMAYDLGLITSYAIGTEDFDKDAFIQKLGNPSGYIGISGALRLKDNITERKYDIIKRQGSEYETLNRDKSGF